MVVVSTIFCACSENGFVGSTLYSYNISGVVEKGPFVRGSTIFIQPLDEKMQSTGTLYSTTIKNNAGEFSFGSQEFVTPYAELTADGYFFNEIKGELSAGTLRLKSVVDLSNGSTVNVNILTHLKCPRILNLISRGESFEQANKQAQKELLSAFGLQKYAGETDASQISITSGNDEAAVLTAISILILGDRSEAQITEYLALLSDEFGRDGRLSIQSMKTIEADRNKIYQRLHEVEENIVNRYSELGQKISVKKLLQYFDWDSDGEAGNELLKEGESVKLSEQNIIVPSNGGKYQITINSPISICLDPVVDLDGPIYGITIGELKLYEEGAAVGMTCEYSLDGNTLSIDVSASRCRSMRSTKIELYDCIGNVVATLNVSQDGNPEAAIPLLGYDGEMIISGIARNIAEAYEKYNILEQSYHFNPLKLSNSIFALSPIPISTNSPDIDAAWSYFYTAIRDVLRVKSVDKTRLNVYQPYCDILLANVYYSMVVAWGDIPYYKDYQQMEDMIETPASRTSQEIIMADIEQMLLGAIDYLDEKHNTPLKDVNGLFFASKDVARMTLANVYMYQNRHLDAMPLVEQIIENKFYTMSEDDFSDVDNTSTFNSFFDEDELIYGFGFNDGKTTRTNIVIRIPGIIALQTITDVYLALAECCLRDNKSSIAEELVNQVAISKNISISGTALNKIKELRSQVLLYSAGYFPFMKRSALAKDAFEIEDWQLLWPIPMSELNSNPNISQNDGY